MMKGRNIRIMQLRLAAIIVCWVVGMSLIGSCSQADSFPYEGEEGIGFDHRETVIALGELPYSVEDTAIALPLTIVGEAAPHARSYMIERIDSMSTAAENINYSAVENIRILPAETFNDTIWVVLHRKSLEKEKSYTLTLRIREGGNLTAGTVERASTTLVFDNRLTMPVWWNRLKYWLGEYDQRKYQKFIELNGKPISTQDVEDRRIMILKIFKQVRNFFKENPQEGVSFPDVFWEV